MNRLIISSALLFFAIPALAGAPAKVKRAPESLLNQIQLSPMAVKRLGIKIAAVQHQAVPRTLNVGGTIMPKPGSSALLRAPLAGTVEAPPGHKALLLPGTRVRAGQTVLRLRPLVAPYRNLLAETRRDLDQAQARFDTADKAAARAQSLLKQGAGDQAGVEVGLQNAAVAKAELRAAVERLRRANRDPLGADVSLPLRAPQDGVISRLIAAEGQSVGQSAPLVEVISASELWVRVPLYVGRISQVDRSAKAGLRPLGTDQPIVSAELVDTPPLSAGLGTVAALFYALPKDANFAPGARVTVQLHLRGSGEQRAVLPGTAVFYDSQGAAWVYIQVDKDVFERRRVDVDTVINDLVILAKAPPKGSKVVTIGAMELYGTEFGIGK